MTTGGRRSAVPLTTALLRQWPLPAPDADGDKESRGRVLVVGGAVRLPGAVVLAATAALRAGAGKLQIATCRSIATAVGVAVPEALVVSLPETREGGIAPSGASRLSEQLACTAALLVGPGLVGERAVAGLVTGLLRQVRDATVVVDAAALSPLGADHSLLRDLRGRAVLTPHTGEMAGLLDVEEDVVERDAEAVARRAAADLRAVVALKGAVTYVAAPDGRLWVYDGGDVGLATSGSGDTLAGIIAGLAARGAEPAQAAVWGVYPHGAAGNVLSRRMGGIGFLAREVLDEVPPLMAALAKARGTRGRRSAGRPRRAS